MEENYNQNIVSPSIGDIRRAGRAALKGSWTNAVLCTLLVYLVSGVCGAFSGIPNNQALILVGEALTILIAVPIGVGYAVAFLRHVRGEDDDELVGRPFECFKNYGRYLGSGFLVGLFVCLWMLLLIVPGIIMAFAYAMTPYVMYDNPEQSVMWCIKESRRMMKGHKWQLFCLMLSFIGWILLGIITLGIGFLWIAPMMQCAQAKFYEMLKGEQI